MGIMFFLFVLTRDIHILHVTVFPLQLYENFLSDFEHR